MPLSPGTPAPAFALPDQHGDTHSLADYRDQWLLIYFYPKDDTPGCTKEACGFRDLQAELKAHNCAILGVSKDSVASHQQFAKKYNLAFPLLSDESTEVIQAYGADKRMSVLVDPEGKIAKVYPKVTNAAEHPAEVLKDIEDQNL